MAENQVLQGNRGMKTIGSKYQLGELAISLGLIDANDLNQALSISTETSLPVGRVLVMAELMSEIDLNNLIRAQTLLRESMIDYELAQKATAIARSENMPFENALYKLGWLPPDQGDALPLGHLLCDANFVTPDQLNAALKHQEKVRLPLGRVLVLNGVLTEALLTAAINAQIMVRDKKLKKEQAIEALKETKKRQIPLESFLKSKGFYDMPNRSAPRLGELLSVAGLISDSELVTALEHGLTQKKPIGEVLVALKLVNRTVLEAALTLQTMIAEGQMRLDQARTILMTVNDGKTLSEAFSNVTEGEPETKLGQPRMPFLEFLQKLKQIDENGLADAFEMAKHNTNLIKQILMLGQLTDEQNLSRAEFCYKLAITGKLSVEHACIVFEYAQRRDISTDEALKELNWQHGDQSLPKEKVKVKAAEGSSGSKSMSNSQIINLRDSALELKGKGDLGAARQIFEKLAVELKGNEDGRYIYCLDALAQTCIGANDFDAAEKFYNESFSLRKKRFGSESLETAEAIDNLGKLKYFQKQFDEAIRCAKEYIRICTVVYGEDHPHIACGWQNVASVQYAAKDIRQAAKSYEIALNICKSKLGSQHPTTVRIEKNYNTALGELKDQEDSGVITGSWRTISIGSDISLMEQSEEDGNGHS
jgi:tetratricopeptide (TPR) repeat protein